MSKSLYLNLTQNKINATTQGKPLINLEHIEQKEHMERKNENILRAVSK